MARTRAAQIERPLGLRVTKLARDPGGYWTANASLNGATVAASNEYGSWQTITRNGDPRRDVLPPVAAALQAALEKRVGKR